MSSADAEAPEAAPRDELREGLVEELRAAIGDAVEEHVVERGDVVVRVRTDAWHDAVEACRDRLGMRYFCFLSGIDWMPATAPNPEAGDDAVATEPVATPGESGWVTGVAGGATRFQVFVRLQSIERHVGVTLKADLDDEQPRVASIVDLFGGAEWHERETWELLGFDFVGHPHLRHLFLPSGFEGHPLRKDFPLLAREVKPWPGLVDVEAMPGGGDEAAEEGGEA